MEVNILSENVYRITLSIPVELQPQLDSVKKEKFYNETKAEMYRFLIKKGLETVNKEQKSEMCKRGDFYAN